MLESMGLSVMISIRTTSRLIVKSFVVYHSAGGTT